MLTIAWASGAIAFAFYVYVLLKNKIPFFSSYGAFGILNVIYWVFPAVTVSGIYPEFYYKIFDLSLDKKIVSIYLLTLSFSILIFSCVFFFAEKRIFMPTHSVPVGDRKNDKIKPITGFYFLVYCAFAILLIAFGLKYPYGNVAERPPIIHSLISVGKTLLASLYLFALVSRPRNGWIFLMLLMFAVLTVLEGSRWYFISTLIATAAFIESNSKISIVSIITIGAFAGIFLSLVGLLRAGVEIDNAILLLSPFYIEGDYGSYSVLQTLDLVINNKIDFYTFFSDYIFDPILYQIPRPIFLISDADKDGIGIFPFFIEYHEQLLEDSYSPVGGFHYLAQATSALPFVGPILVTFLYAKLCIKFESLKNRGGMNEAIYYCFIGGFAFVFVKTIFAQTIKYFLTILIPVVLLQRIRSLRLVQRES